MRAGWEAAAALSLLASGCGLGSGLYAVDAVEDGRAVLVGRQGERVEVSTAQLPAGAREGDVYVDGRADEEARARLLFEIRQTRRRLQQQAGGEADLSLEGP